MLYTNLKHLETADEHTKVTARNKNIVVICGRMEAECIAAYRLAESLENEYEQVGFYDMEYDNPESVVITSIAETDDTKLPPYIVLYRNGEVARIVTGAIAKESLKEIIETVFNEN
jgi:thioredoxin 1